MGGIGAIELKDTHFLFNGFQGFHIQADELR
jgi:hypothetical protein